MSFERRPFSAQSIDRVTLAGDRSKLDIRLLSLEDSLISILQPLSTSPSSPGSGPFAGS
jgi:hypothetical protein